MHPENDYRDYLQHHGILGQRWGVRRFQNKNGSLTTAGRKRYSGDKVKEESKTKDKNGIKSSLNKPLSQRYNELSDEQKAKIKKAAITVGAVALTAAVGYAAYRGWSAENLDKVIKTGTNLHTITANKNKSFDKAFYAAYKTSDRIRYKGMLGMASMMRNGTTKIYDHTNVLSKDVKIPSPKKSAQILADLINQEDTRFKDDFRLALAMFDRGPMSPDQSKLIKEVRTGLNLGKSDPKFMRKAYDAYNLCLVAHDNGGLVDRNHAQFYKKLADLGYGAIIDVNDKKYSGYKSNAPLIVFNAGISADKAMKELGVKDIAINSLGAGVVNNYKKYAAYAGLGIGSTYALKRYDSGPTQKKKNKR